MNATENAVRLTKIRLPFSKGNIFGHLVVKRVFSSASFDNYKTLGSWLA